MAATLALASGCGLFDGNGDDSSRANDTEASPGDVGEFCESYIVGARQVALSQTDAGDPVALAEAIQSVRASAPSEISEDLETVINSLGKPDPEDPEFSEAERSLTEWVQANCGFEPVEITAEEYSFGDLPDGLGGSVYMVSLVNVGEEAHEMQFIRINDGVTLPVEEILELPAQEALARVKPLGGPLALPASTATAPVDLREPGSYAAVCFLPVGATAEAVDEARSSGVALEGPPHFTRGMITTFEVG